MVNNFKKGALIISDRNYDRMSTATKYIVKIESGTVFIGTMYIVDGIYCAI